MHLLPPQSPHCLFPPRPHSSQWFLGCFWKWWQLTSEPLSPLLQHHRQDRGAPPGIQCFVLLFAQAVAMETRQQREAAPGRRECGVGGAIPRASRTHSLHESDKGGRGLGLETPSLFFS